jgi:hypothetical protein
VTGLEPATSGVTGRRSNQLSYTRSGRAQDLEWANCPVKPCHPGKAEMIEKTGNRRAGMGGDGIEPPTISV